MALCLKKKIIHKIVDNKNLDARVRLVALGFATPITLSGAVIGFISGRALDDIHRIFQLQKKKIKLNYTKQKNNLSLQTKDY